MFGGMQSSRISESRTTANTVKADNTVQIKT